MKKINLTKQQQEELVPALIEYFEDELDIELGNLQAQLLLDFLSEKVGPHFYNAGVIESIATLKESMESVEERIDLLRRIS